MDLDLKTMETERRNFKTMRLDEMTPLEIVTVMNQEDKEVSLAIERELDKIAQAVSMIEYAFLNGGRLFYVGAGTSGRLGVLDSSECPPTFGVEPQMVIGLLAGGEKALRYAVEGAEDNKEAGRQDLMAHQLCSKDVVVGIAASGRTPYVLGGLEYAKEINCRTIAISCNQASAIGRKAELAIEVQVGAEVLTGSTRLKAGTAQKLILNMLSTASMVRIGKAYENLMVDVVQSNDKLKKRAENIVIDATGVNRETARNTLEKAQGNVKTAVTMILADCDTKTALELLGQAKGHVREAIKIRRGNQA